MPALSNTQELPELKDRGGDSPYQGFLFLGHEQHRAHCYYHRFPLVGGSKAAAGVGYVWVYGRNLGGQRDSDTKVEDGRSLRGK